MKLVDDTSSAILSSDRQYRYRLTRTWDVSLPRVVFIMLNPSTADETENDQTIRRCLGYAERWGYGQLVVGNLFALRATDPSELADHPDPVGPANDAALRRMCAEDSLVVAAWGADDMVRDRGPKVAAMMDTELFALATTEAGHPVHPLFKPADLDPEPFEYGGDGQ